MIGPKTLELVAGQDTKYMIEKFKEIRQSFYEGLDHFDTFGRVGLGETMKQQRLH